MLCKLGCASSIYEGGFGSYCRCRGWVRRHSEVVVVRCGDIRVSWFGAATFECRGSVRRHSSVVVRCGDTRVSWFGAATLECRGRTGESWLKIVVVASFWINKQFWSLLYQKYFPIFYLVFNLYKSDPS